MRKLERSGIQRKYLKYTVALLLLALLLSIISVWIYMRESLTEAIVEKYEFMDEKMGIALDTSYQKSDEVTADCILDENVQKSLRAKGLEEIERSALSKYFAYLDMDSMLEYCYVDNKQNVYTRSYSRLDYNAFQESGFAEMLGDEYAQTKWIWSEDGLFGVEEKALFIGRYVRCMDYAHEPGMLFLKMGEGFWSQVIGNDRNLIDEVAVGIMNPEGEVCVSWYPEDVSVREKDLKQVTKVSSEQGGGMILRSQKVAGGVLSAYRQEETGWVVFTLVPNRVLNHGLNQVLLVLLGIYLLIVFVAVNLSIYFSRRFTKPIQEINQAMKEFDGDDFSHTIELHTNTELDQIGHSYNEMLKNIEHLLQEIKEQEKELRTSEMNMLISQINPHFLYNTLDTIYMLARINKEETTMKMIQALSKYLRLCLNKGNDIVTVEDELENVKSYMEIQQIRNENLFTYEIDCQVEADRCQVLKLILQPLVENAIKYGFADQYEGGMIRITVEREPHYLILSVYNNGSPIDEQMAEKINGLNSMPVVDMKEVFPDKKHGYGVTNIFTRLRLKYGEKVQLVYKRLDEGTLCIIKIPREGEENETL